MKRILRNSIIVILAILTNDLHAEKASPQLAIAAEKLGDHDRAIALFTELAEMGDSIAMVRLGNKYYRGDGVNIDYRKSLEWWLKAFDANNGDAAGNIGVLFRDGKGVDKNRKIAYTLFLLTHMEGLGTESTQIRVNRHLRREIAELSIEDKQEALCYTLDYVYAYIKSKGHMQSIPSETLPSSGKVRIKDKNWWLDSERAGMNYKCEEPWAE